MLDQILSNRRYKTQPYWQIVYEWEDALSENLGLRVLMPGKSTHERLMRHVTGHPAFGRAQLFRRRRSPTSVRTLAFHMSPRERVPVGQIPIVIDYWKSTSPVVFSAAYRLCPLVYLSSLEAISYLRAEGCGLNLRHLAPSIPDLHRPANPPAKSYDIVQPGRGNPVLDAYMARLLRERPDIDYVQRRIIGGQMHYVSNRRGDLGVFESRQRYLDLLSKSRVALYSSPGMDGGSGRTGGFNPITPRLLEIVANHCLALGRYADNADATYFGVDEVCPRVEVYSQFRALIEAYLSLGDAHPAYVDYPPFLERHYTSRRALRIAVDIDSLSPTM